MESPSLTVTIIDKAIVDQLLYPKQNYNGTFNWSNLTFSDTNLAT